MAGTAPGIPAVLSALASGGTPLGEAPRTALPYLMGPQAQTQAASALSPSLARTLSLIQALSLGAGPAIPPTGGAAR